MKFIKNLFTFDSIHPNFQNGVKSYCAQMRNKIDTMTYFLKEDPEPLTNYPINNHNIINAVNKNKKINKNEIILKNDSEETKSQSIEHLPFPQKSIIDLNEIVLFLKDQNFLINCLNDLNNQNISYFISHNQSEFIKHLDKKNDTFWLIIKNYICDENQNISLKLLTSWMRTDQLNDQLVSKQKMTYFINLNGEERELSIPKKIMIIENNKNKLAQMIQLLNEENIQYFILDDCFPNDKNLTINIVENNIENININENKNELLESKVKYLESKLEKMESQLEKLIEKEEKKLKRKSG